MTKTYAIRPLSYSNFTNREFESLMMDTHQSLATFSKANKDEAMYAKHLEPFKTKLDDFQAQLAAVETKESSNLTEVDRNRDSALVGLFTLHRGFAKIKDAKLKEAHETLKPVFAKYKDITKHSNDVETAEIKSLLKTLSETPYHEAVTSLGLTPMLTAVVNAQEEYDKWKVRRVLLSLPRKLERPDNSVPNFQPATTSLCAIQQPVQKPILKRNT